MISYRNEVWKEYSMEGGVPGEYFRISNYGRVLRRFSEDSDEESYQATPINGYEVVHFRMGGKKKKTRYLHKLMGALFLENPENKKFVVHLDYDKFNNHVDNLKWMTQAELTQHHQDNPEVIKGKEKRKKDLPYSKLSEVKVRLIKRKIFDPNRRTRMKMIAKQFGISEMQLWRIKSGENWGHITDY